MEYVRCTRLAGMACRQAFVGADLTNGGISSGLPVTRQEPQNIFSIGALGVRVHVRTAGRGS
jgi:hypothetical protein